ncbi:Uncharacterised protein [uncultured archaeon]|nr:Uncharacterised protein [uncultured archaeon]
MLDDVLQKIDEAQVDPALPRRVKTTLTHVKDELKKIKKESPDWNVKVTTLVYELEGVSSDVNIPMHAKTFIWNIISDLEALT